MRKFDTGATRDDDSSKNDYEGFLSPLVIEAFGDYMNTHRIQADGLLRDSDNWQKGMPQDAYIKSMFRHFLDLWKMHRGYRCYAGPDATFPEGRTLSKEEALCALLFNVQGYLHEELSRTSAWQRD